MGLCVVPEFTVQDHVVHLSSVWVIGVFAAAARECGQQDGGRKLPVRVINVDHAYGSLGFRPLPCCNGGVQEIEVCSDVIMWVVSKLKRG